MKTIGFIVEQNLHIPGRPIPRCWNAIPGCKFDGAAQAIEFLLKYDLESGRQNALRVVERVRADNGVILDHQIYPSWNPGVRTAAAEDMAEPRTNIDDHVLADDERQALQAA